MKHTYSMETIIHFSCGQCHLWWSIADISSLCPRVMNTVTCPHCGALGDLQRIKPEYKPDEQILTKEEVDECLSWITTYKGEK